MNTGSYIGIAPKFGMAFPQYNNECAQYLSKNYGKGLFGSLCSKLAIKNLHKRCLQQPHFIMYHTLKDDTIHIVGMTDGISSRIVKRCGEPSLEIPRNITYPNYAERMDHYLEVLEHSPEGPQDVIDRVFFKGFRYVAKKFAKLYINIHPYEKLPANVRKSIDVIDELEKDL